LSRFGSRLASSNKFSRAALAELVSRISETSHAFDLARVRCKTTATFAEPPVERNLKQEFTMRTIKLLAAAVVLSAAMATPVLAQGYMQRGAADPSPGPYGYGLTYNDHMEGGYVGRNDFISRSGFVCHPGSIIRDDTGARTVCQ
jgi:hypothetical protein